MTRARIQARNIPKQRVGSSQVVPFWGGHADRSDSGVRLRSRVMQPPLPDLPLKVGRVVLRKDKGTGDRGLETIRKCEIDNPAISEIYGWLGVVAGQRGQPLPSAACENERFCLSQKRVDGRHKRSSRD